MAHPIPAEVLDGAPADVRATLDLLDDLGFVVTEVAGPAGMGFRSIELSGTGATASTTLLVEADRGRWTVAVRRPGWPAPTPLAWVVEAITQRPWLEATPEPDAGEPRLTWSTWVPRAVEWLATTPPEVADSALEDAARRRRRAERNEAARQRRAGRPT